MYIWNRLFAPNRGEMGQFCRGLAQRFADAGICALAFDYLARTVEGNDRSEPFDSMAHIQRMTPETFGLDLDAAVDTVRSLQWCSPVACPRLLAGPNDPLKEAIMRTREQDNASVIAPPPLLYLGPLVLGLLLQRGHRPAVLPAALARLLGWPLVFAGIALNTWMVLTMRRARTPIDPRKPAKQLVTSGPFAISRNPSYTPFTLAYIGIALLRRALWPLVLLPAVLLTVQRRVIEREERYLERRFGTDYQRYRDRVRRWL